MGNESTKQHRKIFSSMVICESTSYYLLHIWDGRYAAFWAQGFEGDHCISVAEHDIHEKTGMPFAFLSKNINEVRDYINCHELKMAREFEFYEAKLIE